MSKYSIEMTLRPCRFPDEKYLGRLGWEGREAKMRLSARKSRVASRVGWKTLRATRSFVRGSLETWRVLRWVRRG